MIKFISLAIFLATLSTAALAYVIEPQRAGDITYITGGIGDEERDALQTVKKDYNLAVTSAKADGEYVGNTQLVISDRSGNPLVSAAAGPLFYAQLPPGRYVIEGNRNGEIKKQNVTIAQGQSQRVVFSWK